MSLKDQNSNAPRFSSFLALKPVALFISLFNWPRRMIRSLYSWVVGWAQTPQAEKALGGIAFAESSFFPIPPDPLLIAMVISQPAKFLRYAIICTSGSVVGGLFGYFIGAVLFGTIGQWIIDTYHLEAAFVAVSDRYNQNAFLTVFTAAFTPIPYKIITITAGVFHIQFISFIIASVLGRGTRFFLVAFFMHYFGRRYKDTIEQYIDIFSLIFVALLVLGFVLIGKL